MSRWRKVALTGIAALLLAGPADARADYCEGENAQITDATAEAAERAQLCLINVHRATSGLAPLTMDPGLRTAARQHSRWMDDNNSLCHYPDPMSEPPVVCDGSPDSRAAAAGYPYATGENIAWTNFPGQSSREMFELWRNSPGHNANMLFADYDTAGIGFVTGSHGVVGTQMFGTEPNGGADTAVELLRKTGCPAAEAERAAKEGKVKRAKRRLRKAKAALAAAQRAEQTQCHPPSFAGSSLSPP